MENIRQAVERARASQSSQKPQSLENLGPPRRRVDSNVETRNGVSPQIEETELNSTHLLSRRVVSYNGADQRSRPYDMLRTQVLQSMVVGGWRTLGVTSPTPGCGKTLTALNLAFSIARQPDQSVVLVDMDLQKPQIANCLGLRLADGGLLDVLEERATLRSAMRPIRAGNQRIVVLPTTATKESSELMGSRNMRNLLQDIRKAYPSHVIVVDLPPVLSSDDVIAVLPQIDCILRSSNLVRLVVNKATEAISNYYYY
jgi:protein-tyrosine kinase